jgi:hypothetical protein
MPEDGLVVTFNQLLHLFQPYSSVLTVGGRVQDTVYALFVECPMTTKTISND